MTASIYTSLIHDAVLGTGNTPVHTGNDPLNVFDGLTFNAWRPDAIGNSSAILSIDIGSAITVDYFAFDGHNLIESGVTSIEVLASNNSGFIPNTVFTIIADVDINSGANIATFVNSTAYRYYKIRVQNTSSYSIDPIISVIYMGLELELPKGIKPSYTPPRLGVVAEVMNNTSDSGNFLGRSLKRKNYNFIIKNDLVSKAWIDANWYSLLDYIQQMPFFYLWSDLYPGEGVLCWTVGNITPPRFTDQVNLSFSFQCNGFL